MARVMFAWAGPNEAWNSVTHDRLDDRPIKITVSHGEWGRRTAEVTFGYTPRGTLLTGKEACHIAVEVDGEIHHLFYGRVIRSPNGLRGRQTIARFEAIQDNTEALEAAALAPIASKPWLYQPIIEEAQSSQDAETILAATTMQMEYDRYGFPSLCSIYGDPNRLKTISAAHLTMDDCDRDDDDAPPNSVVVDLTLEWTQRRFVGIEAGAAIQAEINRIAQHYGENGVFAGNYTFTHGFLEDWPKIGTTMGGSYVVVGSYIFAYDGSGAYPKTESGRAKPKVKEATSDVSGLPTNASDTDAASGITQVALDSTGFSEPFMQLIGVQSKPRREDVKIIIPYKGQQLKPGNGPQSYVKLSARDLDNDQTVEDWENDKAYGAGQRAKANGMPFQALENHISRDSLIQDMYDTAEYSATKGKRLWAPVVTDNSPLGRPDVDSAALTAWGRNAITYAIRRGIADLGYKNRCIEQTGRTSIEQAYDIDPRTTLRLTGNQFEGGMIEGKVKDISFTFDLSGSGAGAYADFTIASAIGAGNEDGDFGNGGDPTDGGDGDQDGGQEQPAATEGGEWDLVRYIPPIVFPTPMTDPQDIVNARIDWLGCEQLYALNHPGQTVWNPYSLTPGPGGGQPARADIYIDGTSAQDFLEDHKTEVTLKIRDGSEDEAKPQPVPILITYGWRGPKQVELASV